MSADQNTTQSTLGEFLRHERERRGITIEQVASATKISVRLLHLLESDQYSELPAKPFIRGFVNSYCRFIGVDPKEVLIRYGSFLEERSHERPTKDQGHSGYAFEKREGEQSRTFLGISMIAFVVLGGLAFIILKPSFQRHRNSHADKLREANASPTPEVSSPSPLVSMEIVPVPTAVPSVLVFSPSPSPSAKPSPKPSAKLSAKPSPKPSAKPSLTKPSPKPSATAKLAPVAAPTPSASEAPDPLNSGIHLKPSEIKYKIILKTDVDTWVRYQVDDRPKMKFILRGGKILVLRASRDIRLQASEPEAISFRLNGGPDRPMEGDVNAASRGKDLTLFFPKQLAETIQDPFPGERSLKGASVPAKKGAAPVPTGTP